MNELIETLRGMADMLDGPQNAGNFVVPSIIRRFREAADIIKHLEAENATLRGQINDIKRRLRQRDAMNAEQAKCIERLISERDAAKTEIAALLWLNGNCEYCHFGAQEQYSGASRWTCKLGSGTECRPEWRGSQMGNINDSD